MLAALNRALTCSLGAATVFLCASTGTAFAQTSGTWIPQSERLLLEVGPDTLQRLASVRRAVPVTPNDQDRLRINATSAAGLDFVVVGESCDINSLTEMATCTVVTLEIPISEKQANALAAQARLYPWMGVSGSDPSGFRLTSSVTLEGGMSFRSLRDWSSLFQASGERLLGLAQTTEGAE